MVVAVERSGEIAVVTIDNPPVNAIDHAMRQGLVDAASEVEADPEIKAAVLIAQGRTFPAGADIKEFGQPPSEPTLPQVLDALEAASKPWVAAVHGSALGGGLELALGCHYRIGHQATRFGLPEVTLGIVPGAGGTVRLPRLIRAETASDLATTGRAIMAAKAAEIGLVDRLAETDLHADAIAFAQEVADQPLPEPLSKRNPVSTPNAADWTARQSAIKKMARGAAAPLRALACVRKAVESDAASALAFERETFLELRDSDEAKALRHVFFAERGASRPPEIEGQEPRPLTNVGVVGGGTMGAGIAAALRDADLPVILVERDQEALARSRGNLERIFDGALKRGRLDSAMHAARLDGVTYTTDYGTLGDCDLVIEAVFEDLDVKQTVFARLAEVTQANAVLATNTSYLDPAAIGSASGNPERVLGLHFFSPAHVMRLLEIVPTASTAPDVLATGFMLSRRLRKLPVLAGICDGFIGNRLLKTMRAQAERLLLVGCTPSDVDKAMVNFGMPMGPFAVQDLGGLDIAAQQRRAARARGEWPFAPIADRLCETGRLGQKTGGGWYDYSEGSRRPERSSAVAAIIAEIAAGHPKRRGLDENAIADRLLFPMINEGAAILDEGIAKRASDIDLVQIHGYGFPRWRGGLMHYAEARGLGEIVQSLETLAAEGFAAAPHARLRQAAEKGGFGD